MVVLTTLMTFFCFIASFFSRSFPISFGLVGVKVYLPSTIFL